MKELVSVPTKTASMMGIPQNQGLITLLRATLEGGLEGKKLSKAINDRQTFMAYDGQTGKVIKEYLTSEALEGSDLIANEVGATILNGQQYASDVRNIFPSETISGNSYNWPTGEAGLKPMPKVSEGAEIKDDEEEYGSRAFTIEKHGSKARITTEMIDDARVNMIERELRNLGVRTGLTYADEIIKSLLDNAGNEKDLAGSNLDSAGLLSTKALLRGEPSYTATHAILHPELMSKLESDSKVTYVMNYGAMNTVSGEMPKLFGMKLVEFDYGTVSTNKTWGFAANDEIGAIVINAEMAGGFVINRNLRIENYKDPIKDLKGLVGTIRFDAQYLTANAIALMRY